MIKKISLLAILLSILFTSCNLGSRYKTENSEFANQKSEVKEVIQTSNYTYLRVERNKQEQWIAIGRMEKAKAGDVYYFEEGLEMKNFESKELGRTFESVLFVMEISDQPIKHEDVHGGMQNVGNQPVMGDKPEKPVFEKIDVKVDLPAGATSIADLYAKSADYKGKLVTVRGKVTKVNVGIMGRNWIHIQDGTASGDNFDLTITTKYEPAVGAIVTYSGTFSLDKDFGYGYYYSIILEDAEPVKEY